jgi:hypothetical protein
VGEKGYPSVTDRSQVFGQAGGSSDGDQPSPPRLARLAPDRGSGARRPASRAGFARSDNAEEEPRAEED